MEDAVGDVFLESNSAVEQDFSWDVPFEINRKELSYLSSSRGLRNTQEEESIPRELIAEEVKSTRFQARLGRPIRIGTSNGLPAYLLCFQLSFQHLSSFNRVRKADIRLTFDDAVHVAEDASDDFDPRMGPSIVRFYPRSWEGPVATAQEEQYAEASVQLAGVPNIATPGLTVGISTSKPRESRLVVHGVPGGRPTWSTILWIITENEISNAGIPREMQLPLIVTAKEGRRFACKLVVNASYGMRRGVVARNIPVLGKRDDPLFFDPTALEQMATAGSRSMIDGELIATKVGSLDTVDLSSYSSFPKLAPSVSPL